MAAVVAGLLLQATSLGCATEDTPKDVAIAKSALARTTTPSSDNLSALGASNRAFASDLYRVVAADPNNAQANLVFSPYSVSTALAMTYEGARGTTESEIKAALHFDLDKPLLHEAFNATDLALSARGEGKSGADGTPFRLNVDNSLWAQQGKTIVPTFLDVLAVNYGAGVFLTDFARDPEAARKAINGWVEDKTEQLIPELLKPRVITERTRFVLTNTVYFNASWATKFNKVQTQSQAFHKLDGTDVSVPSMWAGLTIPYADGENYRAIALPYEGDQLRFVAVLPDEGALAAVEAGLSADWFAALDASWQPTSIAVRFPQLDYKQHTSLKDSLKALGMNAAFGNADFSGMTDAGVFISDVLHEAVLKVFEEGTIAAAATAVVFAEKSATRSEQTILFDRPFLFAIVDQPTGAVLFLGRVLDPSQK